MFRQSPHNLTTMYRAILATFIGLGLSSSAYALNLGQPLVHSEQHEPLSATIPVSNIDANNFSASIAPAAIYSQLGLSPSANIFVKFEKTSDNSGNLVISSQAPVSAPFADVVLNLNNDGEQYIEPQTLLMPLSKSNTTLTGNQNPVVVPESTISNLPVTSVTPLVLDKSLDVRAITPPVSLIEPEFARDDTALRDVQSNSENADPISPLVGQTVNEKERVISSLVPEGTNRQIDILTEQVTRRILSPNSLAQKDPAPTPTPLMPEHNVLATTSATSTESTSSDDTRQSITDSASTYVVQKGDNLWSIAYQIAKANDSDVQEVMAALHTQNPDAFINNKANQLKANATLTIPNYRVVLSQKAIEEAISSKKQQTSKSAKTTPHHPTKVATKTSTPSRSQSIKQPLPTAQVSLVAQSQNGQAAGSQAKTAPAGGINQGSLVESLKDIRAQTAQNAKRVNTLNQELSSATQRLQLKNQQLAELEARLKALKDK